MQQKISLEEINAIKEGSDINNREDILLCFKETTIENVEWLDGLYVIFHKAGNQKVCLDIISISFGYHIDIQMISILYRYLVRFVVSCAARGKHVFNYSEVHSPLQLASWLWHA